MEIKKYLNGFGHIGIPVKDMDKTIEFYKSIGFEISYETMDGNDRVVFFKLGDLTLETFECNPVAMADGAVDHFAIDVNDVESIYAEVTKAGYEAVEGGIQFLPFFDNGVKFFTIKGPNAEKVEFSQIL